LIDQRKREGKSKRSPRADTQDYQCSEQLRLGLGYATRGILCSAAPFTFIEAPLYSPKRERKAVEGGHGADSKDLRKSCFEAVSQHPHSITSVRGGL